MKFLNIVILSESSHDKYREMYTLLSDYYKVFNNTKTIFITLREQEEDYNLIEDILYMKGTESYMPGILEKTIKSFEYYKEYISECDYIIRSNISTIIDFNKLEKYLHNTPVNYYGGARIYDLQWLGGGIEDDKWFGTIFVSGTSIILTNKAIDLLLEKKEMIQMNIIDDVSFGIFFRELNIKCDYLNTNTFCDVPLLTNNMIINDVLNNENIIFYRNKKMNNRQIDVIQMKIIIDAIRNKYNIVR